MTAAAIGVFAAAATTATNPKAAKAPGRQMKQMGEGQTGGAADKEQRGDDAAAAAHFQRHRRGDDLDRKAEQQQVQPPLRAASMVPEPSPA